MKLTSVTDTYTLGNGVEIPCVGFGTWQIEGSAAADAVAEALAAGYRLIDTAAMYHNEQGVGEGIRRSGVPREQIFVQSKLDNLSHGYEETKTAFAVTLESLGLDYLDVYLIHWPNPIRCRDHWKEANAGSWRAMEELYAEGKIRAIGVSNFHARHLDALYETANIKPMINQVSLSPGISQPAVCEASRAADILLEGYSPLGRKKIFEEPAVAQTARRHGKTPAQICLRWSLQMGFLPLPKSVSPIRMRSNMDIFDFELSDEEMAALTAIQREELKDPDTISF